MPLRRIDFQNTQQRAVVVAGFGTEDSRRTRTIDRSFEIIVNRRCHHQKQHQHQNMPS